jgi:hypothetical protein
LANLVRRLTIISSYLQFHSLAYFVKLHIEIVMTDLIIKIVRYSGPTSSASGTVDTSRRHVQHTSRSEAGRLEGVNGSGATNGAANSASVSAENGPWPFPEDPSLFGIEKTVACQIEPADSESTMRDVDADGNGRQCDSSQQSDGRMEDEIDADGHGRQYGGSHQINGRMEDEIDADGHGRRFGEV